MKKLFKITLSLLLVSILLSSCSTVKVTLSPKKAEKIDKIALISTYLGMKKPVLPLIDAAIINEKINGLADQLNPLLKKNAQVYRANVAKSLKSNLNCEVVYGDTLQKSIGFQKVMGALNYANALNTADANFPQVMAAPGDLSPFQFEKAKIDRYFRDSKNYKNTITQICKDLNMNYIAISNSYLAPIPGGLLARGSIMLLTTIYIFTKDGDCIALGTNFSKPFKFTPTEIDGYQQGLDEQLSVLQPILEKIAVKYKN